MQRKYEARRKRKEEPIWKNRRMEQIKKNQNEQIKEKDIKRKREIKTEINKGKTKGEKGKKRDKKLARIEKGRMEEQHTKEQMKAGGVINLNNKYRT